MLLDGRGDFRNVRKRTNLSSPVGESCALAEPAFFAKIAEWMWGSQVVMARTWPPPHAGAIYRCLPINLVCC
jgi:hypothetical protein